MGNPSTWYSQKHMDNVGIALMSIGIWVAIIVFPAVPILSPLLFALIGGPGVYIGYKLEDAWALVSSGSLIASLVYAWIAFMEYVFGGHLIDQELFFSDFFTRVVPVLALGTLPLAWFRRRFFDGKEERKTKGSRPAELKKALGVWIFCLFIIVPFTFALIVDYNQRGDTSPPQVIQLKVVKLWTEEWTHGISDSGIDYWLKAETLDGKYSLSFRVSSSSYSGMHIGSLFQMNVYEGALGYKWMERT